MKPRRTTLPMRRCVTMAIMVIMAAVAGVLPCSCTAYRPIVTRPPTFGEELLSLEQARKDGLLTQAEYEERRAGTIAAWKEIGNAPVVEVAGSTRVP
jgi:hypothetical protein